MLILLVQSNPIRLILLSPGKGSTVLIEATKIAEAKTAEFIKSNNRDTRFELNLSMLDLG